ncbi:cytochrome c1 [Rhabdaerophilum calidifontis]|uniref:cytochrome c1 n=1 Tax=Rhabdaerophilum calidifontis TaxID=2604328 RepID=UPI00123AC341|nr:cytochrome c1 [Rhabdaerophilum calidifontis]
MTKSSRPALLGAILALGLGLPALAAGGAEHPPAQKWSFAGPFGTYDRAQLQRGFKIYREVCAACHGLEKLSFRNLVQAGGPQFSVGQIQTLAAEYKIQDGPNESGEMFERPGRLADRFPKPFPNPEAAKAANNGAVPPDFSVIAKARTYERGFPLYLFDIVTQYQEQGVDYITALLTGYEPAPAGVTVEPGLHWNKYFPGNKIAMANPLVALFDDAGKPQDPGFYTDGTPLTREQVARDLSAFLMWVAEPHLEERKRIGARVMLWLLLLAGLLYFTKKKIWARVEGAH